MALLRSSKTIGAERLSELAASLETAAGDGDEDTIIRDHQTVMELYGSVVSAVTENMELSEETADLGDGDILEFAPKEDTEGTESDE